MQKKTGFTLVVALFLTFQIQAQQATDTLFISLPEAEKIFLQKNLQLLAAQYNVDANAALIKQARSWDNPLVTTDQNIYDGSGKDGKFFAHNSTRGQYYVQVTELLRTAGKRNKLAQIATDNTVLAREQFREVIRDLHYTLRSDLIEISHQLKIKKIFTAEIDELQQLITGMNAELKAGNIALKDNMRLKALLFSLQNEVVNVESTILPIQSELKLLLMLNDSSFIAPRLSYDFGNLTRLQLPSADSLRKLAYLYRPAIKIADASVNLQEHNLAYQRALAKADITVGTEYDQHSSYNPNYVGLTVALPLNIFNRNEGNIKAASINLRQQQTLHEIEAVKIQNEVLESVRTFLYIQSVNNLDQLDFSEKYNDLFQNMMKTYKARQINLLEFIDFLDAYKDTRLKLIDQHNKLLKAIENINYSTNSYVLPLQ